LSTDRSVVADMELIGYTLSAKQTHNQ